jgi:hypothetical protein
VDGWGPQLITNHSIWMKVDVSFVWNGRIILMCVCEHNIRYIDGAAGIHVYIYISTPPPCGRIICVRTYALAEVPCCVWYRFHRIIPPCIFIVVSVQTLLGLNEKKLIFAFTQQ